MDFLKNNQFLKLWGNQVLLQVAFNICNFTALLLIDYLTQSRFALAQFYAAITVPAFLVGLFAGVVVDSYDRKKLMLLTDFLLAILFFLYAFSTRNYAALLVVALSTGAVSQFFIPAEAATIPLIVKPSQLEKANTLFLFTGLSGVLLGYALAGPIIQAFGGLPNGARAAFVIASIFMGIGFFLRLSITPIVHERPERRDKHIFKHSSYLLREVLLEASRNKRLMIPIILLTIVEFNIGMLAILFIEFVRKYLALPTDTISYFLVIPLVAGLIIGMSILGMLRKRFSREQTIFLGGLVFATAIFLLGLSAKVLTGDTGILVLRTLTVFGSIIIGLATVFIVVHSRTILQENTKEVMLGRVFSLVALASAAVVPIPILIISFITEKVDAASVLVIFGMVLIAGVLLSRTYLLTHLSSVEASPVK